MKIKLLSQYMASAPGDILDVGEGVAKLLIQRGVAVKYPLPKPKVKIKYITNIKDVNTEELKKELEKRTNKEVRLFAKRLEDYKDKRLKTDNVNNK